MHTREGHRPDLADLIKMQGGVFGAVADSQALIKAMS
jgi:hypothetical protein